MENLFTEQVEVEEVVLKGLEKRRMFRDQALNRAGQTGINNLGSLMVVDEYNNSTDLWVRFPQGHMVNCTWQQFQNGSIKNVYDKSKFGIGYIGEADYKVSINGEFTRQYLTWSSMLMRSYSKKFHEKHPTYKGCTVVEEWHNYQNFAAWYDQNFYEIDGHRMDLDKDILIRGNRLYSPETCVFVPQFINTLFVKREASRGSLPVGVRVDKSSRKNPYMARSGDNKGAQIFLGNYNTPELAFYAYKEFKEKVIKEVSEEYRDKIPAVLYNAMLSYTVEIDD